MRCQASCPRPGTGWPGPCPARTSRQRVRKKTTRSRPHLSRPRRRRRTAPRAMTRTAAARSRAHHQAPKGHPEEDAHDAHRGGEVELEVALVPLPVELGGHHPHDVEPERGHRPAQDDEADVLLGRLERPVDETRRPRSSGTAGRSLNSTQELPRASPRDPRVGPADHAPEVVGGDPATAPFGRGARIGRWLADPHSLAHSISFVLRPRPVHGASGRRQHQRWRPPRAKRPSSDELDEDVLQRRLRLAQGKDPRAHRRQCTDHATERAIVKPGRG